MTTASALGLLLTTYAGHVPVKCRKSKEKDEGGAEEESGAEEEDEK